MRKLTLALAIGLLLATTGFGAGAPKADAAVAGVKVVIVVGQTQSQTASYIANANDLATTFSAYTSNITKIYSPNATWAAVKAAAKGANILVYLGHGSGWPNPYPGGSGLQPMGDNGMGLNDRLGTTSTKSYYYGESYMAQLELAPGALVLLNHLCYASGNNDSSLGGNPTLDVAKKRVEGYAAGFVRAGAGAVLAEGLDDMSGYVTDLFTEHETIDALWRSGWSFHDNVISWSSTRNPGVLAQIDPDTGLPSPTGYYRSLVGKPGLTTDQVLAGGSLTFSPGSGSFYPINPTVRLIDTRLDGVGPSGKLASNGVVNYQITGAVVPTGAVGITANLTVTRQSSAGTLYVAPTIDSGSPVPASTVNFPKGDNRANGITVGLSTSGTLAVYFLTSVSGQSLDFIIDVTGYFLTGTAGAGYNSFGPQRVVDSRIGQGGVTKLYVGHHQTFQVAGVAGLPSSGIVAVVGNLAVVRPTAAAFVYLGPNPTDTPTSSTINFPRGDIRANNIILPLNANGTLSVIYSGTTSGSVDIVLDISGYFTATGGYQFHPLMPARILDSRANNPLPGPFPVRVPQNFQVTGRGGVAAGAVALVGNLAATGATCGGYASIGPTVAADSLFSNLNYPAGDTRANGATTPLTGGGGAAVIYGGCVPGNTSHMLLDVYGYYLGGA